ncbi:hypothetical protein [Micromonospora sp. NPDC050276]|uniref:hypothetical protein n=1 Tax=Micromonospora sp. NPDC050276 TaxID=3364278 RepID=UPI0037B91890
MPLITFHLSASGGVRFDVDPTHYERYRPLGAWVSSEVGKHFGVVLDALATVDDAAKGGPVEPWTSESYDVTIDAAGIRFRNHYADSEQGEYSLDELRPVLEDYWRFLAAIPETPGAYREYSPELPLPEAEVRLWEQVWGRTHPYRGRLF